MQGFISRFFKKQWFCFWKNNILLSNLLTVMTKTVPVHSYHSWLSFRFLFCLVINLKMIGRISVTRCPEADGWGWLCLRGWEPRISATDSVLCSQRCSWLCVGDKEQEQAGMQTHGLIYSDLLLRQQETFHGVLALVQVQETLACNTGQNLNCLSCLRVLPLISVILMVYPHYFLSSCFRIFIFSLSTHFHQIQATQE